MSTFWAGVFLKGRHREPCSLRAVIAVALQSLRLNLNGDMADL